MKDRNQPVAGSWRDYARRFGAEFLNGVREGAKRWKAENPGALSLAGAEYGRAASEWLEQKRREEKPARPRPHWLLVLAWKAHG